MHPRSFAPSLPPPPSSFANNTRYSYFFLPLFFSPQALHEFVFDFGALSPANERRYVEAMVGAAFPSANPKVARAIVAVISAAQGYVREVTSPAVVAGSVAGVLTNTPLTPPPLGEGVL